MTKLWMALAGLALGSGVEAQQPAPAAPVKVTLTRLDCGRSAQPRDLAGFSDTYASYRKALVSSCYLIRHGDEYLLWDTGYPVALRDDPKAQLLMPMSVLDQLKRLGVEPARIGRVGISHYHGDHTGQARDFSDATLLIGTGDWAALTATERAPGVDPAPLVRWVAGGGKVEPVRGDKDVWGDGTVTILDTPGHTPGHHSLLVRLAGKGPVLLTGDLAHFTENYETNGVPRFNTNRADTLASLDRFKAIARNLKATVVIQHEPADVAKLPAFPAAAE
jgi:glyoxylase-like metal-dependent hydrolase (beta-lactamase superfamily II)